MTVLVTGAAGFIGRYLCEQLRARGDRVVGLDQGPAQPAWCDAWVQADITLPPEQNPALRQACEGVATIFHLAGKVHALAEVQADVAEYHRINTLGTEHLLRAAAAQQVGKFVFFSTIKVYGDATPGLAAGREPLHEATPAVPDTPYGQSKLEAEQLVLGGKYLANGTVLRLCMVYGPGAKGNIAKMIRAMSRGIPFLLPEFNNRRAMVDVRDVVRAALLVADQPASRGQVYIVSDGGAYSSRQIAGLIARSLGRRQSRLYVPVWTFKVAGKVGDGIGALIRRRFFFDSDVLKKITGSAWFSSDKIVRELHFQPQYTLEKSLPEMIASITGQARN